MNTRQAIQPSDQPSVLNLGISSNRTRFIAGLSEGIRVFRSDTCLTTYEPSHDGSHLVINGDYGVVAVLDDQYLALVGAGRMPQGRPHVVVFWDAVLDREVNHFDFHEPVLGVKLSRACMLVILRERVVLFQHQAVEFQEPTPPASPTNVGAQGSSTERVLKGPNKVRGLYPTAVNVHALACLGLETVALPAQSVGQVQLVPLFGGTKRVLRAHNSALRCMALSDDGSLLVTASEQGTLIRVFSTVSLDQLAEFRRGLDHAIMFSLAISPGNRWLACTSDKGTLHMFDLKPPDPAEVTAKEMKAQQHRKSQSYAGHRLSAGALDKESLSGMSGHSSPVSMGYQGSVQEYYGLRPPPMSASPPGQQTAISAMAALKSSPFAPRILKDVRSVASAPIYMGDDPPYWQGGPSHSWTTTPNGQRKRVRNPVPPLAADPAGRPPKGIIGFAPGKNSTGDGDDGGAALYVIGGGSDPRWEYFELLSSDNGGWALVNRGFRKYLTTQFVD